MSLFSDIPIRINGTKFVAEWVNALRRAGVFLESLAGTGGNGGTPGRVANISIKYVVGTGVLSLVQGDNSTNFTTDSPGTVTIFDNDTGKLKVLSLTDSADHFFEDANGGSDIDNMEFGVTSGIAWGQDRNFYVYVADTSVGARSFISPDPTLQLTPSSATNHGYHATPSSANTDSDIFWMNASNLTAETSVPCVRIGGFRMRMSTGDDWTVQTLATSKGDGIRSDPFNSYWCKMPTNQNGAASGSFLLANGGTQPAFTNQDYYYKLSTDGRVHVHAMMSGDGGTDGSGGVATLLSLPYKFLNLSPNVDSHRPVGSFNTLYAATTQKFGWASFLSATPKAAAFTVLDTTTSTIKTLLHSDFSNGNRNINAAFIYQAFGTLAS